MKVIFLDTVKLISNVNIVVQFLKRLNMIQQILEDCFGLLYVFSCSLFQFLIYFLKNVDKLLSKSKYLIMFERFPNIVLQIASICIYGLHVSSVCRNIQ